MQAPSAPSPLHAPAAPVAAEGSTRCDCCKSCGAILELDGCGHRFHSRCIYAWPIKECDICQHRVNAVHIFRPFNNRPNLMIRKGKWSPDEHKYANMMMKQFQQGALPLVDGLHLRAFMASLLQCDPLRVTKKYAGYAIGKQNFFFQAPRKQYCYAVHSKIQKRVSALRNHFYWHIQYRCKFGYSVNIQDLKLAEADFWIRELLRFAKQIGQRIDMNPPPATSTTVRVRTTPAPAAQVVALPVAPRSPVAPAAVLAPRAPSSFPPPVLTSPSPVAPVAPPTVCPPPPPSPVPVPADPVVLRKPVVSVDSPLSFDEWQDEDTVTNPSYLLDLLDQYEHINADMKGDIASIAEFISQDQAEWQQALLASSWTFSLSDSQEPPIYS